MSDMAHVQWYLLVHGFWMLVLEAHVLKVTCW
jgi:hypothetical protein